MIAVSTAAAVAAAPQSMKATLVNPAPRSSFVAGDAAPWRCEGVNCTVTGKALKDGPAILCKDLAYTAGEVASFEGLDAAQLEKCNKAKRR